MGARPAGRRGLAGLLVLACLGAPACGGAGGASAAPATWIGVEEGRQCELGEARRAAQEAAWREALVAAGVAPRTVRVGASLEQLPEACRPSGGLEALAERARRAGRSEVAALLTGLACSACGCPQAWLVCVEAAPEDAGRLDELGLVPVRERRGVTGSDTGAR